MQSLVKLLSRITGLEISAQGSAAGDAMVAQGAASYEEITRAGLAFHCISATSTAAVVAIPTTASLFSIWNSADDGGKSIVIDAVFGFASDVGAAHEQSALIYVLGQTRVATNAGAIVVRRNNGYGATNDSVAICDDVTTLDAVTGVTIGWMPIGNSVNTAVVSLGGQALYAPVDGRLIVPPGRLFALHVISASVGGLWQVGAMWHEKQLTLG